MKYCFFFLLLASSAVHAQNIRIKEIKCKPSLQLYAVDSFTIAYPVLVTPNKRITRSMNDQIKMAILAPGEDDTTTRQALQDAIDASLISLDYMVTFKNKKLFSIKIYGEGCGAYCSSWASYFNFDPKTGKDLTIGDIIREDKLDSFRHMVMNDKIKTLQAYKKEEKESFLNDEVDTSTYEWAMEEVDACLQDTEITQFCLSASDIEIISPCDFAHAIRSQEPEYELKYSYAAIAVFLKPEYLQLFLK